MYTPEQVRVLLETAKADRLHALWYLAISTGLRRSELAGLKWEDIDSRSSQAVLMVRRTRTMADNRVIDSTPKTRAGRRTIVLDQGTVTLLAEHRELMVSEARQRGDAHAPDYVFVDELGEPYIPIRLTRLLHGAHFSDSVHPVRSFRTRGVGGRVAADGSG